MAVTFTLGADADFGALYQALGLLLEKRTSDPANTTARVWVRTDTAKIKWFDGTTIQTLADLNSVVGSVTAADGTITIAGSSTAVTVKVAKTLDHTYITDFDTQVRTSSLDQMAAPAGDVSWNNHKITNLTDATSGQDAVNLRTVQRLIDGLDSRGEVYYAATGALPANTYANGTLGVGATLTATANGALTVDGAVTALNDPILVPSEATAANNGRYILTQVGDGSHPYILTRSTDFDEAAEVLTGCLFVVKAPAGRTPGAANDNKIFTSVVATPTTIGTTAINFGISGSTYTAGAGITLTGNVFSLTAPVSVLLGGTGSTTAAGARTNLGVLGHFEADFGDGATTTFTIAHGLGVATVRPEVRRKSDGVIIRCGLAVDATNITVTIGTSGAPIATNSHTVMAEG